MELNKFKYIKNQHSLPSYEDGKSSSTGLTEGWEKLKAPSISSLLGSSYKGWDPTQATLDSAGYTSPSSAYQSTLKNSKLDSVPSNISTNNGVSMQQVGGIANYLMSQYANMNGMLNYTSVNNILADAGSSANQASGVYYQQQNDLDKDKLINQYTKEGVGNVAKGTISGAATGAKVGGVPGAIVGAVAGLSSGLYSLLTGKNKLKKQIERAKIMTNTFNTSNKASAISTALQSDWNSNHQNTQDNMIYSANKGKDMIQYTNGKNVWSPFGLQQGPVNSMVGKGESVINYNNGSASVVNKGTVGKDTQPSSVSPTDDNVIAGNDQIWGAPEGYTFAKAVEPYTQALSTINKIEKKAGKYDKLSSLSKQTSEVQKRSLEAQKQQIMTNMKAITDTQQQQHQIEQNYNNQQYNYGKDLYGYKKGKSSKSSTYESHNINLPYTPYLLGEGIGLGQVLHYANSPIHTTNTYVPNTYGNLALEQMSKAHYNPYYQLLRNIYGAERRAQYENSNSGGMMGGQSMLSRVTTALGSQANLGNMLNSIELENIKNRQAYAQMLASIGNENATRMQNAMQYDDQVATASHGARQQGIEMGHMNMYKPILQYAQDKNKSDISNNTLDLYWQDLKNRSGLASVIGLPTQKQANETVNILNGQPNTSYTSPVSDSYNPKTELWPVWNNGISYPNSGTGIQIPYRVNDTYYPYNLTENFNLQDGLKIPYIQPSLPRATWNYYDDTYRNQ